ncbi:MAG: crossover junction endodeoxyribonuclease RuvC [Bdellovibrionales bacterium]|nr:crossover junction endodeoxyribonuclease RuvC [Bdellovibrionales bacterium]
MRLIMGIDPGSRVTGWGIIQTCGNENKFVDCGTISLNEKSLSLRLLTLYNSLLRVIDKYKPQDVVVEKIFLGKNADSAFKLGHARGVCIMSAASKQIDVYEYAARKVKQSLTGSGAATKEQVQLLAMSHLKIKQKIALDASDALSLALCHAVEQKVLAKILIAEKGVFL